MGGVPREAPVTIASFPERTSDIFRIMEKYEERIEKDINGAKVVEISINAAARVNKSGVDIRRTGGPGNGHAPSLLALVNLIPTTPLYNIFYSENKNKNKIKNREKLNY